ncbi:protein phosphatase 2C domain-containing protein [Propionibacteriaceae bacterium G1746]|uniref:PP2C family protein-serine/threonine phosphatase n=1 Tax=Aestuariimicrobium sp. G57 TaxID=3418485 RepID=UPI003C29C9F9
MTFSLDVRSHSETGPLRKNNQDSGFASPNMLVVADGMGGAAAGDLASTVAISFVERVDERHTGEDMLSVLAGAVSRANDKLADLVAADHSLDGMGTTVTGAMFSGDQLGIVHIGDSRAYVLRDGHLDRITTDHSWVMSLVAEGKISEAEAETHPHRNLLLKVLNGQPTHTPDAFLYDLSLGDRLLLCSDGLCGFANDATILEHLRNESLDDAMNGLVKAAYAGGGADNITIVLADVVPQDDELDAKPAVVVGAAIDTRIPDVPEAGIDLGDDEPLQTEDGNRIPRAPAPVVIDPEQVESIRYAPTLVRRRRWFAPVISTVLILVALMGIAFAGIAYTRTQYYVGASGGTVAIYNGVPGQLLGVKFQRKAEDTDVKVDDLPAFYQQKVHATIDVADLDSARATVAELRVFANACREQRAKGRTPSTAPSPSGTPQPSTASALPSAGPSASQTPSSSPVLSQTAATPSATASPAPGEGC